MRPQDEQFPKLPRPKQEIELSTIYWYRGELPAAVALTDASLRVSGVKWGFSALYGHRGRQEGFMAARHRALETGESYTVIDIKARMENPILQERRTPDNIGDQDILPVHFLVASFAADLDYRLRTDMHLTRTPKNEQTANVLLETLVDHPHAAMRLLEYPELEHVKVLVYQARAAFSHEPLTVATIREEHLSTIFAAQCRLDPDMEVILPRASAPRHRERVEHDVPTPTHSPRGPSRRP